MQHRQYKIPLYTEEAIGYIAEEGQGQWVGIYRKCDGRVVWTDGTLQHPLPGGLTEILAGLWGELLQDYGYLLHLERRTVDLLALKTLMPFLQAIAGFGTLEPETTWLEDERDAQEVTRRLVDYAESLLRGAGVWGSCGDCYYGYGWDAALRAFAPCAWCASPVS